MTLTIGAIMRLEWWEPFERSMSDLGVATRWWGDDLAATRELSTGDLSGLVVELSPEIFGEEPRAHDRGGIPWAGVPASTRSEDIALQVGIEHILWGEDEAKRWLEFCVPSGSAGRAPLVVITGTGGAPGASTLAIAVATLIAESHRVVLLDADFLAPSLAQMLGLREEPLGLQGALRVARNDPPSLESILSCAGIVGSHRGSLSVLSGMQPGTLDRLEASAGASMVECLREAGFLVVAEVKASQGREGPSAESDLVDALISLASTVIAVAGDSEVGVCRFVRFWESSSTLRECDELVVLLRAQPEGRDGFPSEAPRALWELTGIEKISSLPDRKSRDWATGLRNLVADVVDAPTLASSSSPPSGSTFVSFMRKHLLGIRHKPLP
jgi:hypothetical protein